MRLPSFEELDEMFYIVQLKRPFNSLGHINIRRYVSREARNTQRIRHKSDKKPIYQAVSKSMYSGFVFLNLIAGKCIEKMSQTLILLPCM